MKRDPRLVGLSREHHHALTLAARLRKAAQAGNPLHAAAQDLVQTFYSQIAPHFEVEEELLLPALEAQGGHGLALATQARQDHAWLRQGAALAAAGQTTHLADYGQRMADHVRFEERELFEHAQATLDADVLAQIHRARPS